MQPINPELVQAVAVTAELCGRTFSENAARVFVEDLTQYPVNQVLGALRRCRREVRGILTVNDVVSRLDDGRLGVEEAWAMMPITESQSVVWTQEMATAFGAALPLVERGDMVGARMAFKEAYQREITISRDQGSPVTWFASLGYDPQGRKPVLEQAVKAGRLTLSHAQSICPQLEMTGDGLAIANAIKSAIAKV